MVTAPGTDRRTGWRVPGPGARTAAAPVQDIARPWPARPPWALPGLRLALTLALALTLPRPARGAMDSPPDSLDLTALSLEQLSAIVVAEVDAASGHRQKVTQAPSSVTIVTAEEIARLGYTTLAEALNGVAGLYTRDDRNYSYVGIRGFAQPGDYNTHVLILVDGHRLNELVGDRGDLGEELAVELSSVDRIEVVRGPGSSLYGSSAFFGVINLITHPAGQAPGLRVSTRVGALGERRGEVAVEGGLHDGTGWSLSGSYLESAGEERAYYPAFDSPETNFGVAVNADAENAARLHGALRHGPLEVQGGYLRRGKHIPTAAFETVFNDSRTRTVDTRAFLFATWEREVRPGWGLRARLAYDRTSEYGTYIYPGETEADPSVVNIDDFLGQSVTGEAQVRHTLAGRHELTGGVQLRQSLDANQKNSDVAPAFTYLDDRRSGLEAAAYLQDEVQASRLLRLNVGVRYDHSYASASAISPRVGLIATPDDATTLKLLYGRAFHAPSPNQEYYADGGLSQVPSAGLDPERVRTAEVVAEHRPGSHWRLALSGFHFLITNLIGETSNSDGLIQLVNQGRVRAEGLEAEAEGRWARGLALRAGWSVTNARDDLTDERLRNSPVQLGKLALIVPLVRDDLHLGVEGLYAGRALTRAGAWVPASTLLNLTLSATHLPGGLEPTFSVTNVFDRAVKIVGGPELLQDTLPGPGRAWRLSLTVRR